MLKTLANSLDAFSLHPTKVLSRKKNIFCLKLNFFFEKKQYNIFIFQEIIFFKYTIELFFNIKLSFILKKIHFKPSKK